MSVYFLAMYLCGASFGPLITGRLSDYLARNAAQAAGSLRAVTGEAYRAIGLHQAMYVIPVMSAALALVLYAGSRTIAADMARRDEAGPRRSTIRPMKLLIFSDIHGDLGALTRLMETEADYYVAAGDLVNFGRGLDRCGEILRRRADRVYVLPGNHETAAQIAACAATSACTIFTSSMRSGAAIRSQAWAIPIRRHFTRPANIARRSWRASWSSLPDLRRWC